ncbi:hypothetical protein BBJ28_00009953, partial [Nothophytophthora sp. Chile5]
MTQIHIVNLFSKDRLGTTARVAETKSTPSAFTTQASPLSPLLPRFAEWSGTLPPEEQLTRFTVIKTTLHSFCKESADRLIEPLNTALLAMNKATTEAYILANLHVLRLCVEGLHAHLQFPTVDQLFFDRCLSAVSTGCRERKACEDAQLQQTIELYKSWRPIGYEPADTSYLSSGWMSASAQMMAVNTNNALLQNFVPRFQKYLRLEYRLTKAEARDMVNRIIADTYDGRANRNVIMEYRADVPRPFSATLEKPHLLIPLMFTFLKSFEAHHPVDVASENADPKIVKLLRLYTLLPHKSGFCLSYCKINTTGLRGLLL